VLTALLGLSRKAGKQDAFLLCCKQNPWLTHLHAQPRAWLLHLGSRHPQIATQPVLLLWELLLLVRLLHTQHTQTRMLLLHRLGRGQPSNQSVVCVAA
jgi:hypothetical protein